MPRILIPLITIFLASVACNGVTPAGDAGEANGMDYLKIFSAFTGGS